MRELAGWFISETLKPHTLAEWCQTEYSQSLQLAPDDAEHARRASAPRLETIRADNVHYDTRTADSYGVLSRSSSGQKPKEKRHSGEYERRWAVREGFAAW